MNTQATNVHTSAAPQASALGIKVGSELIRARLVAGLVAGAILFTVGFAHSAPIHNTAHDTRHTQSFPCH